MARIMNSMAALVHEQQQEYYSGVIKCDDPACGLETRQLSVNGGVCLNRGCNGRMSSVFKERILQNQLKYLECLFDCDHVCKQLAAKEVHGTKAELEKYISRVDREISQELYRFAKGFVDECAYNWVSPSFWQGMFGSIKAKQ
jgi:DNA polymerase alpha subunit A